MAKPKRMTTPAGIAKWPWLVRPNTKYDPAWSTNLVLDIEEAQDLMKALDAEAEQAYKETIAKLKKEKKAAAAKQVRKKPPYEMVYDEEGEETGQVEFKFKQKCQVKKDGKVIDLAPPRLFDAKGKPIKNVAIYGGSIIKVCFMPIPYYIPSSKEAGVSLRLIAVQVIDLVSAGGRAEDFGFTEEDGYEYDGNDDFSDDDFGGDDNEEEELEDDSELDF